NRCLSACDCKTAPYCISKALIAAVDGDWENGLFFCGANAGDVRALSTVQAQMEQIQEEWRTNP
ncbi:MAG: nitronate monooxygenase, partial [Oscillibacter sp.]|nr:nitronate monooxygenase [Oscillibacter sp.]